MVNLDMPLIHKATLLLADFAKMEKMESAKRGSPERSPGPESDSKRQKTTDLDQGLTESQEGKSAAQQATENRVEIAAFWAELESGKGPASDAKVVSSLRETLCGYLNKQ